VLLVEGLQGQRVPLGQVDHLALVELGHAGPSVGVTALDLFPLADDQKDQVKCAMHAAFSLDAEEGIRKLKQLAQWLEQEYPSAASSLLEGLDEMFTINRLGLPKTLRRCLGSTNVIESPNSGIRSRTRRVKNWQDHAMVVRWVAASLLDMEKRFKRVMGYQQLWMLEAKLKDLAEEASVDTKSQVA